MWGSRNMVGVDCWPTGQCPGPLAPDFSVSRVQGKAHPYSSDREQRETCSDADSRVCHEEHLICHQEVLKFRPHVPRRKKIASSIHVPPPPVEICIQSEVINHIDGSRHKNCLSVDEWKKQNVLPRKQKKKKIVKEALRNHEFLQTPCIYYGPAVC